MRRRATLLTLAVIAVIALTAIVPQFWQRVKVGSEKIVRAYDEPPEDLVWLYLPFLRKEGSQTTCVPIHTVDILGETQGLPGTYTFYTDLTPINATSPFRYRWDNADTTASSTRDLGAGEHTLEVTVCNCDDACVTDEHTITIQGY